jgi:phytoene dehydrogenase-like protein
VTDAVVIGAGPNGLVAANLLADAGWRVVCLEANDSPGGAVRSAEVTAPGFVSDLFSAFYPLAFDSPALQPLRLHDHGLRWSHAPVVLAHPAADDGACAVLSRDLDETAASLDRFRPGDGDAWRRLYGMWSELGGDFVGAMFGPFPPARSALRLARTLRLAGGVRFARFALLPVRRLAEEEFGGAGGGLLLAGNAMHADIAPEAAGSGALGWLLSMLGQQVGFPVPVGGAGALTDALVRRLVARGGELRCGTEVSEVLVRGGRAVGVRTADGTDISARRAVLADVSAPSLYLELLDRDLLPTQLRADLRRFQWDNATVKVDWALRGPIPWRAEEARRAGTVHVADSMDDLTQYSADLSMGRVPASPFLLVGQMTTADPTRSPAGTESAWAYTHVPQRVRSDALGRLTGSWDDGETAEFVDRMEARMEQRAPGFRDLVIARHVQSPRRLEAGNANLRRGAVNAGTANLHQQLVFRPLPGLGRPETFVRDLYLASASAHPGGGAHGATGANAARAALAARRPVRRFATGAVRRAHVRIGTGGDPL